MNKNIKHVSLLAVAYLVGTTVIACVVSGTHTCAPKGSTVEGPLATCAPRGGEEQQKPEYIYTLEGDCTTPWACLTFGAGFWDYSEGTTSCTVPISIQLLMANCSYLTVAGGGTLTITDCPTRSPIGTEDCPAIEPPPPGGGTWCLKNDSNASRL